MANTKHIVLMLALFIGSSEASLAGEVKDVFALAASGDVSTLAEIIEESPGLVNARDAVGNVPLHYAIRRLHDDVAQVLLKKGADVNVTDRDGLGLLHVLSQVRSSSPTDTAKRKTLALILIENGANVDLADRNGISVAHVAAIKGRTSMLGVLLQAGARIDATDQLGRTPLFYAAMYNHVNVLNWLRKSGAEISRRDGRGETALHVAASRFRKESVAWLVSAGVEVNAASADGSTPLHLVASTGPEAPEVDRLAASVAKVLLDKGANSTVRNEAGLTPIELAKRKNRQELMSVLMSRQRP